MARSLARALVVISAAAAFAMGAALAEDGAEKSRLVRVLEGMVSTPDRLVTLSGLEGAFSSSPTVEKITVSDTRGPWLEIEHAEVVWTRRALFRRVLDIQSLTARRVTLLRRPGPAKASDDEDASSGLPVEIAIDSFRLPEIVVAAGVAGGEAKLSADGSADITGDAVAARLAVLRKDRPGSLSVDLRLKPEENVLAANLQLAEPAGGLLADALQLKGRPAISISVAGAGPLTDWRADIEMQADGARILAGGAAVARVEAGYRISGDLAGAFEAVAPDRFAALLGGDSRLAVNLVRADDGALDVESASFRSDGAEFSGSGAVTPDLVPSSADISLRLGQAGRTALPFVPGEVSVTNLAAKIGLDPAAAAPWQAEVTAEGMQSAYGGAGKVVVTASGQASSLAEPGKRATTFRLEGMAERLALANPALAEAFGSSARLTGAGSWAAGQPVAFESLQAILAGATASFAGTAQQGVLDGRFGASITNLGRLALLLDRPLQGSAQFQATGNVALATGDLNLQLAGDGMDLSVGIAALDPLLAGTTRIGGGVAKAATGVSFDRLTLGNAQVSAELSGAFSQPEVDLSISASVADLSSLTPRASGSAKASARVIGTSAAPQVDLQAEGSGVVLMGRPLTDPKARFFGIVAGPRTSGKAELSAKLGDVPVEGSAELIGGEGGARAVRDLLLQVGASRASGDLTLASDGLIGGDVEIVSPDLSTVAPLFLAEASGMLQAEVNLSAEGGAQSARFSGVATDLIYENVTLDTADLRGVATDLFSAPRIDGEFALGNLKAGSLVVIAANGTAKQQDGATGFSATAELPDGEASAAGTLRSAGNGLSLGLDRFAFARAGIDLVLAAPTMVTIADGTAQFPATTLNAGGGRVTIAGRAGATLDMTADVNGVSAELVNVFAPDIGAEGTLSGRAIVSGAAAAPIVSFDAEWQGASIAASRNAGLGSLSISTDGRLAEKVVGINSRISNADGVSVQVVGTVGTTAGAPLDLRVTGAAPLSLANRQLASRGAALQGEIDIDLTVAGTSSAPRIAGRLTSKGGGFVDPGTGVTLRDLALAASFSDNRLVIDRLTARSGDGTVSAKGSIGLDVQAGFPADLAAEIRQARYVDGSLVSTRFDADLTLQGGLARNPVLGGSVFLDRTEVTVPESLPRDSVAVDVEHVNIPKGVQETLTLARRQSAPREKSGASGPASGLTLNLTIAAPQQIFVRGRGLDAELGGEMKLTGPIAAAVADGTFEMNRGRLDIFTQRVTFDRGIISFAGDLDPILDFSGTTQSDDVAITVAIAGEASDPEITFSSVPELPQDEVLAHLIFNRGIAELSPVQIARLADAAAQFSGAGGGLLNQLRASTGLDDLDIVTDEEGGPALAAGRYVNENVYIGVQQGTSAESSRVTIDLDISKDVKARAGVSPQGNSSLGVFYEREY